MCFSVMPSTPFGAYLSDWYWDFSRPPSGAESGGGAGSENQSEFIGSSRGAQVRRKPWVREAAGRKRDLFSAGLLYFTKPDFRPYPKVMYHSVWRGGRRVSAGKRYFGIRWR